MSEANKSYDVFLSFNTKDLDAVRQIARYLANDAGLHPWFDDWELVAGDSVVDEVYQGLEAVPVYAVFLGQHGEGPWQTPEIRSAVHNCVSDPQRRIIPVFLPDAPEKPVLPPFLKGYKWVDFRGKALDDPEALRQLVKGIRQAAKLPPLPPPSPPPDPLRDAYLHHLYEQARMISLVGIDRKSASREAETCLDLSAIYTALLTQSAEYERPQEDPDFLSLAGKLSQQRRSVVAQLNAHPRLVLLGDPGSGKSTFVNFVVMCFAGELLLSFQNPPDPTQEGRRCANLDLLTAPLPKDEDDLLASLLEEREGKRKEERQPWKHGPLLPVRVVLRDFAARGLPPAGQPAKAAHLWDFLTRELANEDETLGQYAPSLRRHLQEKGGLLLLDGLDEVPEAEQRRTQIKQVVKSFARSFPKCRLLVTSRTYAYQQQDWKLNGFAEAVLAPFSKGQIGRFVDGWYQHIAVPYDLRSEHAEERADLLKRAIFNNDRLYSLAERPLLLTLMASLHAWRGGNLPEKRVNLYEETVELLLDRWELHKKFEVKDEQGRQMTQSHSLAEWLNVDRDQVRTLLHELAFDAHARHPDLAGTADLQENRLVNGLMGIRKNEDVRPARLVGHLRDRAGLLVSRGVGVYTFPHRTFQEYLAACHAADDEDYPDRIAELARSAPERWREVVSLAGARVASRAAGSIWGLTEALCYQDTKNLQVTAEDAWGALLAGQALAETAELQKISPRNQMKVQRIRDWLAAILTEQAAVQPGQPFPAVERALAGRLLAKLGDPRPGVGLRDDGLPEIEWREIPAGSFLMGSDEYSDEQPIHPVTLPAFKMSRYPVTNAQYQAFVADGGTEPDKYREPFGLSNHPVVGVSWDDAMAFCAWLTAQLRNTGELQAAAVVRLPSEAEWEYAARGPESLIYPWGHEPQPDPELANYSETNLGATSAVGCFPRGVSRFSGCEELAGNVWEWCADDWHKNYKGAPEDGHIWRNKDEENMKIMRGGELPSALPAVRLPRQEQP